MWRAHYTTHNFAVKVTHVAISTTPTHTVQNVCGRKKQLIWLLNTMTTRSLPHYQIFYWQPSRVAARSHYIRCFVLWPATGLPAGFWLVCVMKTSFTAFVSTAYLHFRLSLQDPVFLLTSWSTYILNLCCRFSRQSHCLENATRQHLQSSPKTV